MKRSPSSAMARASDVLRSSLHAFFQSYHYFTSVAALLVLPFSASVLLSEVLVPSLSSILRAISSRIQSMFHAAGFPPSAFFSLLNLKLSQTIFTFIFTLPFTLSFLLLAKACIVAVFRESPCGRLRQPPCAKFLPLYPSLLLTHVFNSFVILSSNAATFSLLFLLFNAVNLLGLTSHASLLALSAAGAIVYSVVVGIATVICNLSIIVSAMERCGGFAALLKACLLIRGHVPTALALALPTNLGMAFAEALFQLRVVGRYRRPSKLGSSVLWEAFLITYIHSLCVLLEIVISCMFFKSCKMAYTSGLHNNSEEWSKIEPEDKGGLQA